MARKTYNQPWYEGQTINLSIGQGYLQVDPLQMAVAYSALVNGGKVVRPHVASALVQGEQVTPLQFKPARQLKLKDQWAIRQGLYMAAHSPGGRRRRSSRTSRSPSPARPGRRSRAGRSDHSWYASWAPANHPKVVVVVIVAHGGFGAQAAAPPRATSISRSSI